MLEKEAVTTEDTIEHGLDLEFFGEVDISEKVSSEPDEQTQPHEQNKYFLFSWGELEEFQKEYKERLDNAEANLREPPEDLESWRIKNVTKWARETADDRASFTHERRWQAFPSLIIEFMFRAYGLSDFLDDPNVSEIHLDGHKEVRIVLRHSPDHEFRSPIARTEQEFLDLCRNWVDIFGIQNEVLDNAHPHCNIVLPNGDRMHVIGYLTEDPCHVTIRRHDFALTDFDKLVDNGTMPKSVANFLKMAIAAKLNIMVAGSTGSGKTTLMRCMLSQVPAREKIITIEDTREIGHKHTHPNSWVVSLCSRGPNSEGEGAVPMQDLITQSLRMTPSRVIVGEVRGEEVVPMLMSMSQGNDGSLATIHANSAREVVNRLQSLMKYYSGKEVSDSAALQTIGHAVELVVFLKRVDGKPKLAEIIALDGGQLNADGAPAVCDVFKWNSARAMTEAQNPTLPLKIKEKLKLAGWQDWDRTTKSEII